MSRTIPEQRDFFISHDIEHEGQSVGNVVDALMNIIIDYEESSVQHNKLVRELDVALNGEDGAAKQASLCDIVSQVKNDKKGNKT